MVPITVAWRASRAGAAMADAAMKALTTMVVNCMLLIVEDPKLLQKGCLSVDMSL
jgi:hypothetical protein